MQHDPFDEFVRRMMKQFLQSFEEIERELRIPKRLPEFVIKEPGRVERRSGFSISFSSDGMGPPKIEIRRFGPSGRWERVPLEKEEVGPVAEVPEKPAIRIPIEEKVAPIELKERVIPEYNVSVDTKEVTITLNAEKVESKENVKIKFYPESVEIYAASPKLKKGYFCTVAIPASVDKQRTTVEVGRERVIVRIPRRFPV